MSVSTIHDIAFHRGDLALDLYLPVEHESKGLHPLVIYLHGGGYKSGDKASPRAALFCQAMAEAGFVAASVNYSLGTEEDRFGAFPKNLIDIHYAITFLRSHYKAYAIDPDRIALAGSSAGAMLAMLYGYGWDDPRLQDYVKVPTQKIPLKAVVEMYGPCEFVRRDPERRPKDDWLAATISPINYLGEHVPPTFAAHGDADAIVSVEQGYLLESSFASLSVPFESRWLKGAEHSFPVANENHDLRPDITRFLTRHFA